LGDIEENTMKTIDKDQLANAQGGWYGGYGFRGFGGNPYWAAARAANYAASASYWNNAYASAAYAPLFYAAAANAFAPRPPTVVYV
jgi:hypothetical protein